ncbi:MAG: tRNA (N6-threonylcarbamoyladenosine(37)-N6)-methyltransferase TrmO [Lachnospiraceae bacterium]|nr:tRNA (N6-threonylcarbamoyladenosine(37)-N6)-methyltransferase TrmO [Lachnospiraceae bacterium]
MLELKKIATIHTDLPEKFGIPRQAGLVPDLQATITFEEGFDQPEAVRGLEGFSHIWLLWLFEHGDGVDTWHPTVRPPKLGGNTHMGVFATRSPFRPNPIGLSCVTLDRVEVTKDGTVLYVSGADLRDGTAIVDIKPYLPYADAHESARAGWTNEAELLDVEIPKELLQKIPAEKREALRGVLSQDPRPAYQEDENRIYGLAFAGYQVKFRVQKNEVIVEDIL